MNSFKLKIIIFLSLCFEFVSGYVVFKNSKEIQNHYLIFNTSHLLGTFLLFSAIIGIFLKPTNEPSEFRILQSKRRSFWVLFLGLWAFIPLLGPLISTFLFIMLKDSEVSTPKALKALMDSSEVEDRFFQDLSFEMLSERFETKGDTASNSQNIINPMVEVMKSGDLDSKKRAVRMLRIEGGKDSIHLLKEAQKDDHYDIQYLATMSLLALEKEWLVELKKLLEIIQSEPSNFKLHNSIAESYVEAYQSGLASGKIAQVYLKRAEEHLQVSLNINSNQSEVMVEMGKIYIYLNQPKLAKEYFIKAIKLQPNVGSFHFWKAEAHFYLMEFDQSQLECSLMKQTGLYSPKIKSHVEYWGEKR